MVSSRYNPRLDCVAVDQAKFWAMERRSGRLHGILSTSRPGGIQKRVKRTKPDGTRAGMDEPIAVPRGRINGPLEHERD
jgi:hypothetical protein